MTAHIRYKILTSNSWLPIGILSVAIFLAAGFQAAMGAGSSGRSTTGSAPSTAKEMKAEHYFQKGLTYQKQWLYEKAAGEYEKAVAKDPRYAEAWSNLGYCYRKQGRFDEAVAAYQKAINLDPDLAEAYEYLGEAYAEMKKFDLAENQLRELRRLGSDEADELEAFIEKMKGR